MAISLRMVNEKAAQRGAFKQHAKPAPRFLQLVLLSVIMVGQKVSAQASDKQALQTYRDAEALLKIQDELHRLLKVNTQLTEEIHRLLTEKTDRQLQ